MLIIHFVPFPCERNLLSFRKRGNGNRPAWTGGIQRHGADSSSGPVNRSFRKQVQLLRLGLT